MHLARAFTRAVSRTFVLFHCLFLVLSSVPTALHAQEPLPAAPSAVDIPDALPSITGKAATPAGAPVAGVTVTATLVSKPRIILLPGFMGTELVNDTRCENRPSGELWFDASSADKLEPLYLDDSGTSPRDSCDVIRPHGPVEWPVSPYASFLGEASRDFEVLAYPGYDWRLDLNAQAEALDAWITANVSGSAPLHLVAHSMGGLVARAFVADATRAAKVTSVVTVGTPYLGAPNTARLLVEGKTGTALDYLLSAAEIRALYRTSPGLMQLLPSEASFTGSLLPYYRMLDGTSLSSHAAAAAHLVAQGRTLPHTISQATAFHSALDGFDRNFHAAGKYTVLYSSDRFTPSVFREKMCGDSLCLDIDAYVMGDGDVPATSAALTSLPGSSRDGVAFCGYESQIHDYGINESLLADNRIVADVLHVLKGEATQFCDGDVSSASAAAAPAAFREISVWGKGRVQVLDAAGNFTGVGDDGVISKSLPDVTWMLSEGGAIITLPPSAPYRVRITQTGDRPMQVLVANFGAVEGGMLAAQAQATFDGVPSVPGGALFLPDTGAPIADLRLEVDADGDGAPDLSLPPDAVLRTPAHAQDAAAPFSAISLTGATDAQGRFTGPVTLVISAADNDGGSGVLSSRYSLDGGQIWLKYGAPIQVPDGAASSVQVYSTDKAGNREYPPKEQTFAFAPPATPPTQVPTPVPTLEPTPVPTIVPNVFLPVVGGPDAPSSATLSAVQGTSIKEPVVPLNDTQLASAAHVETATGSTEVPTFTAVTGADGRYSMSGLPPGVWQITAARDGYAISPATSLVTLPTAAANVDFTAVPPPPPVYPISGSIIEDGLGKEGVTLTLAAAGTTLSSTTTDANGAFSFPNLLAGTYVVTPSLPGHVFSPAVRSIAVPPDVTDIAFIALPALGDSRITGAVTDALGAPLANISVTAFRWIEGGGVWDSWSSNATDANGIYELGALPAGTYRVGFQDGSGQYASEYSGDAPTFDGALEVVTSDAQTFAAANAELAPATESRPGAWCWFSNPRAVHYVGAFDKTYWGVTEGVGDIIIYAWDHGDDTVTSFVLHAGLNRDDHANPSLLVRPDGRLMATYATHVDTTLRQRISTNPEDISAWEPEMLLDEQIGGELYSYSNTIQLTGEESAPIYNFYRAIANRVWQGLWRTTSHDNGLTWSAGEQIIYNGARARPYWQLTRTGADRIDFALTDGHPDELTVNGLYHLYYQNGAWFRSDGATINAPLPLAPSAGTMIHPGAPWPTWVWDITTDANGFPVIAYTEIRSVTDHRYRYARWTGTAWQDNEVMGAGGALYASQKSYSGGAAVDRLDPAILYLAREIGGKWSLWRYRTEDGGATWAAMQLTAPTEDTIARPVAPQNAHPDLRVLYWQGRYTSYTDYDTAIFSWPKVMR